MKYAILPVTPFEQNCSLLQCDITGKVAIVDPGGDVDRIHAALERIGGEAEKILVTHAHLDHVGAVAELAEALGLPIEGPHPADQFWIDMLPQQARMMGFPPSRPFTPDRWLHHGDTVAVGETRFQVLHCPGHTPGHVVFYQPEAQLALVGDVLFNGSIGRTDFPQGDHQTLIEAIRGKLFSLPDDVAFIPGHGPMSTIGHERHHNPFVADHRG
jgi:glyoxylase-like metal-dependent hydrolase (beta-lactamase superfamily II)